MIRWRFFFSCVLLFFILFPAFSQFRGDQGNGMIAVAGSAGTGRVITVGGRLTPFRKISHSFTVDGYVDALLVQTGDRVKAGDPLIRLTRDVVGETYLPVILESRIDGVVSEIHVAEKEQVSSGTAGVTVLDDSSYLLNASLSDRDAMAVRKLDASRVTGLSPEGSSYPGRIRSITTEPDYTTGLFTLTIQFSRSPGLYLGTVLFVDLSIEKASGISIDQSALFREGEASFIWVINEQGLLEKRSIIPGEVQDERIFIQEGLSAGERYVRKPAGRETGGMSIRELVQANMAGAAGPENR